MTSKNSLTRRELRGMIEHTLLDVETTGRQVERLCQTAHDEGFLGVCVPPCWVRIAARKVQELAAGNGRSPVRVVTVVGFPMGYTETSVKKLEAQAALTAGADEIDMVINVGKLLERQYAYVRREIELVADAAHFKDVTTKAILEMTALDDVDLKENAVRCAYEAGANFVKTSTGLHKSGGATEEDIRLMKRVIEACQKESIKSQGSCWEMGIKASGSIRKFDQAKELFHAGATRFGCSKSVDIVSD